VTRPSIVLADEPTGNLDSKTGEDIMSMLDDLHAGGQTIILVTHEEHIAEHAHRLVRLRDGLIESDEARRAPVPRRVAVPALEAAGVGAA
jgi:putative ABC transport system ATP-binding protein